MTFLRLLHLLALLWMMVGIGAVVVPIWRAWASTDLARRVVLLTEAQHSETQWLLPGVIATGVTGFAFAAGLDMNLIRTGWLAAKEVIYAVDVFLFLPLTGVGLRRVRFLALQAEKRGEVTDELKDALADNVPLVFGTLMALSVPVLMVLALYKPF